MKKPILLSSLVLALSFAAFASNTKPNVNNSNGLDHQKQDKVKTEKKVKYDFSLFKFITPHKIQLKQDSVKPAIQEKQNNNKFNGETTIIYEKPRDFLMFS